MNLILMILGGILAGYLVSLLQKYFQNKGKLIISDKILTTEQKDGITKILAEAKTTLSNIESSPIVKEVESWNWKKFFSGMTTVKDPSKWGKDIHDIFNLRKLIIVGVIVGVIYGAGWFMAMRNKPVQFNLEGKEATIKLNDHFLKIDKQGNAYVTDKDGKVLKTIKVKDIPALEKALRPYGIDIKYFACAGGSLGETSGGKTELGVGVQTLKYYKWNINHFITSAGLYPIGLGYKVTDNFDVMAGIGVGYKGDKRVGLFGKWAF